MASVRDHSGLLFRLGWLLVLANLAGMAWAVYVPIGFYFYQQDILFSLDTARTYGLVNTLSVVALLVFGLLQVFFTGRLARLMVRDSYETAAAEASLKVSRASAVVLVLFCTASLVPDVMFYRRWADYYQLFN